MAKVIAVNRGETRHQVVLRERDLPSQPQPNLREPTKFALDVGTLIPLGRITVLLKILNATTVVSWDTTRGYAETLLML